MRQYGSAERRPAAAFCLSSSRYGSAGAPAAGAPAAGAAAAATSASAIRKKERARAAGTRALPVDRKRSSSGQPLAAIAVIFSTTYAVSTVGVGKISVKLACRFL